MTYGLNCNGQGGARKKNSQIWLENNNRIKIEGTAEGVVITNLCSSRLRVRTNGDGSPLKTIRKGKSTGLLVEGQNVFIEGKTFQVQSVA